MNAFRSCPRRSLDGGRMTRHRLTPFRMFALASGLALLVLLVVFGGLV